MNWKPVAAVVLLLLSFAGGWSVRGWKDDSIKQAIDDSAKKSRQAAAEQIAKIQIVNTTVQNKVIERIRTEIQYQECRHSPDTFKLILEAFE